MTEEKLFKVVGNMYMSSHILVNTHKTTQMLQHYQSQTNRMYTHIVN